MIRLSGCLHTSRIIANYVKDSVKSIYLMKGVFMVFVLNGAPCLPSKEIEGVSHFSHQPSAFGAWTSALLAWTALSAWAIALGILHGAFERTPKRIVPSPGRGTE